MIRSWRLLGLLIFLPLLAGLGLLRGDVILLSLPFLLYLAAARLATPRPPKLTLKRRLEATSAAADTSVVVEIAVTNEQAAIAELLLEEELPAGLEVVEGETSWLLPLAAGETRRLRYAVRGSRGEYQFSGMRVTLREAGGVFRRQSFLEAEASLLYYPLVPPGQLKAVPIRPRRTRVYAGDIPARVGGEGLDFHGVRPFRPGDPRRRVNWRASARRDSLFTNQFEQERVADVVLILDVRRASNLPRGTDSLLDESCQAAAVLADSFLEAGNRVALLNYGGLLDYTLPGYGRLQRRKLWYALARARLGESAVFEQLTWLPTRLFPPGCQIVFVSPLLPDDVPFLRDLRAAGYRVLVVSPNPVVFEQQRLPQTEAVDLAARLVQMERALLLQQLRGYRVAVLDWDVTLPFAEVAHRYLRAWRLRGRGAPQ